MPIEVESPEELGYNTIKYNLAESSVRDIVFKDLDIDIKDLVLAYGEHRGSNKLRALIVNNEPSIESKDVLVTSSAATALFIIHTSLLSKDDHLIVIRPNYATNLETPKAIGCQITYIDIDFDSNFEIDISLIKEKIKSNTKLISITSPHNPTGIVIPESVILLLSNICDDFSLNLLVDETYRDLQLDNELKAPSYAANFSKSVISVASLSKAFGVPGIRTGWLISKDTAKMEMFLAAKEQIMICNSVVDEAIAEYVLENKTKYIAKGLEDINYKFNLLSQWSDYNKFIEVKLPQAGVVCFPRIKKDLDIDLDKFYSVLYQKYSTVVGPGHWFNMSDRYMRIGFGYPTLEEFKTGLENIDKVISEIKV